jgi:glycosyltransferase involved in cell wall biosynthesis
MEQDRPSAETPLWTRLPGMRSLASRRRAAGGPRHDLIVLDDTFPHLLSAFRICEFNEYLEAFPRSAVYSTGRGFACFGDSRSFPEVLEDYARRYPQLAGRVNSYSTGLGLNGHLATMVFLNNALKFLEPLERNGIPFVFTLYPGGGFDLDQPRSDTRLRRILRSRQFRKVIATQKITRDYLLERAWCDPADIEYIYGGTFPAMSGAAARVPRRRYGHRKDTFDICFVAHKYMPGGADKGYDVFVAAAKILASRHPQTRFHVVGQFDRSDADVREIEERLQFYGPRTTDFFPDFYAGMDIILSPNAPFMRGPGVFDGFPTGCCIEAGLCGVAVFCTDSLSLNPGFEDGREIVLVSRDPAEISAKLEDALRDPEDLYRLAERGREAFARVFDLREQMKPRMRILSHLTARLPDHRTR